MSEQLRTRIFDELESLVLENRLHEIARHRETALAELERYVGPGAARRPIAPQSPRLPHIAEVDRLESGLTRHPAVAIADAAIRQREVRVDLALQEYRPAWAVEAGYGLRGGRSDVASIGVSVEMPLFERRRQDEGVAAARDEVAAGELARQALLLDMRRSLVIEVSRLDRLTEQETHQRDAVLPAARDTREAVLEAYQNDVADFPELVFVTRHGCEPWVDLCIALMRKWPNLHYSTSAFAPRHYPPEIVAFANGDGAERVVYAGYFPMGLSLERIMGDMQRVALDEHVWPLFLRGNARRLLGLD